MKMQIQEWANINRMTPEEFTNEIVQTLAAIAGIRLDERDGLEDSHGMAFTVQDKTHEYRIIVARKANAQGVQS
jgi:hypothetical protein